MKFTRVSVSLLVCSFVAHAAQVNMPEGGAREVPLKRPTILWLKMKETEDELKKLEERLAAASNAEEKAKLTFLIAKKRLELLKRKKDRQDYLHSGINTPQNKLQQALNNEKYMLAILELKLLRSRELSHWDEERKLRTDIAKQRQKVKRLNEELEKMVKAAVPEEYRTLENAIRSTEEDIFNLQERLKEYSNLLKGSADPEVIADFQSKISTKDTELYNLRNKLEQME